MSDPVIEHSAYTWDPVGALWVHEKGPEVVPPPLPDDVDALQTYFFDRDSQEWLRTVLGATGRELAARWEGAHRIPLAGEASLSRPKRAASGASKRGPGRFLLVVAVVLLAMAGGTSVLGAQSGLLGPMPDGLASLVPLGLAPNAVAAATTVTLADGATALYTGPTLVVDSGALAATVTVVAPDGRPATGQLTVILGNASIAGSLDANGRLAVSVPTAALAPGPHAIQVRYNGALAQLASITVR